MTIKYENDPIKFYKQVQHLLMEREAENNLPLGLLERMISPNDIGKHHLVHIQESNHSAFMSMRIPPHFWIIPSISSLNPYYLKAFAQFLFTNQYDIPGVLGEREAVNLFLKEWNKITGQKAELHMEQGIYQLKELKIIRKAEGRLVVADSSHSNFVSSWMYQFGVETNEPDICERASSLTEEMIKDGRLHLWVVGDKPVSMVSRARTTKNGATINGVFTPDEFKRQGYASQAVWHLTNRLLKQGFKFCALYTDLSNPTSNSIYKRMGYGRIGDSVVYKFN